MPAAITLDAVIPSTSNTKWHQEISKEPAGGWGEMLVVWIGAPLTTLAQQASAAEDTNANILNVSSSFCPMFPISLFSHQFFRLKLLKYNKKPTFGVYSMEDWTSRWAERGGQSTQCEGCLVVLFKWPPRVIQVVGWDTRWCFPSSTETNHDRSDHSQGFKGFKFSKPTIKSGGMRKGLGMRTKQWHESNWGTGKKKVGASMVEKQGRWIEWVNVLKIRWPQNRHRIRER